MFYQLHNISSLKPNQVLAILNNCITSPPNFKSIQLLNQPRQMKNLSISFNWIMMIYLRLTVIDGATLVPATPLVESKPITTTL